MCMFAVEDNVYGTDPILEMLVQRAVNTVLNISQWYCGRIIHHAQVDSVMGAIVMFSRLPQIHINPTTFMQLVTVEDNM